MRGSQLRSKPIFHVPWRTGTGDVRLERAREISRSRFAARSKIGYESLENEYMPYIAPLYRLEEEYKLA